MSTPIRDMGEFIADNERARIATFIEMEGWTVVPELSDPKKAKALADLIRRGRR